MSKEDIIKDIERQLSDPMLKAFILLELKMKLKQKQDQYQNLKYEALNSSKKSQKTNQKILLILPLVARAEFGKHFDLFIEILKAGYSAFKIL